MTDLTQDEEFRNLVIRRLDTHSQELRTYGKVVRQVEEMARTVQEVSKQVSENSKQIKENKSFLFGNGDGKIGVDEQLRNINLLLKFIIGLAVPVVLYVLNFFVDKILHIP